MTDRLTQLEEQLDRLIELLKDADDPELHNELSISVAEKLQQIECAEYSLYSTFD